MKLSIFLNAMAYMYLIRVLKCDFRLELASFRREAGQQQVVRLTDEEGQKLRSSVQGFLIYFDQTYEFFLVVG